MLKLNVNSPDNGHQAQFNYETAFARKIHLAIGFPNYGKIEKWAQEGINAHTGCGYTAIRAGVYMNKVIEMTDDEFVKWARYLDYYETPNGLYLLKDWHDSKEYFQKARAAAQRLMRELVFDRFPNGTTAEDAFGLPYTSTSAIAAIWNCNSRAHKKGSRAYLAGIAINADGAPVAFYKVMNENGDEIGDLFEEVAI
ncbi:MAG: hypothetical protein NC311_18925 [Muribaculaceae bacterium]|nr:hypothetical protein [Muribaculaceae bacterium]